MKWSIALFLILTACNHKSEEVALDLVAVEVAPDMRYYHSSLEFSIAKPRGFVCPKCYEGKGATTFALIVQDDFGHLLRVESSPISDQMALSLSLQCDRDMRTRLLEGFFYDCILPNWHKVCPLAAVKIEKIVSLCDDKGYFVIIYAPEGSTLMDELNRTRADAWRAYLIAFHSDHLVIISTQESFYQLLPTRLEDLNPNEDKLFNDLKAAFEGYRGKEKG